MRLSGSVYYAERTRVRRMLRERARGYYEYQMRAERRMFWWMAGAGAVCGLVVGLWWL
jgi:hypothetical protein